MASKYWIKLYHEILDDHKMGTMSDRLFRRTIQLFLLAGDFNKDGDLPDLEAIAWRLHLTEKELSEDLDSLIEKGIISKKGGGYWVPKFSERQSPMSDTERQRLHRKNERKAKYYGQETVTNRDTNLSQDSNASLVDIDKDKESEVDIDVDIDNEKLESLFEQCQKVYETKKGRLITNGRAFSLMIKNFLEIGVTSEDYAAAIDEMDADPKYKRANRPTSYESWAISIAEKRHEPKKNTTQNKEFPINKHYCHLSF